jgi:hypothetical protein
MPVASICQGRLVVNVGVEVARRVPEQAQRTAATCVIPDARSDDATMTRHSRHLGQPGDRIRH